ncbi:hypothetical protein AXW83_18110 [Bosea sp. PAMC 26642]|nr:hypothetical protein AXW83_18110 [Bosea sp. PAMC 26642]
MSLLAASVSQAPALPLAGIRVIEFTHTIMGPYCGMVLADLGADVIKIEAVEGDRTRKLEGFAQGFFPTFNRNKRAFAVNLKSERGQSIVKELIATADVVIENFAPGTMERLGLGFEQLAADNPALIYCALKGFLTGPYEHRLALDEVVQHMSGLAYMTGLPGKPMRTGASVVDIFGGLLGAFGILTALRERDKTGQGQFVRSALFEAACCFMAQHLAGEAITGIKREPLGAKRGTWAVYRTFQTSDDKSIFLAITSDQHWRRFCAEFRLDDLLTDPSIQTNEDRVNENARLMPIIEKLFASYDLDTICKRLDAATLPFSESSRPGDLFDNPQLNHEDRMLSVRMPNGKMAKLPRMPLEIGNHDFSLRNHPPELGEHTEEIMRELGLGEELSELSALNVVRAPSKAAAA